MKFTARHIPVIFFAAVILYFGRTLLVPICYGLLIAMVLYPLCKWLEQHRWPRSLAISTGLLMVFILFSLLITLLAVQVNVLRQDIPELIKRIQSFLPDLQHWIATAFGFNITAQNNWWHTWLLNVSNNSGQLVQTTLSATAGSLFTLFLVPVYAALFLYNRETFVQFLATLAGNKYRQQLQSILSEVLHTYASFVKGMIMVYLIVGILNSKKCHEKGIRTTSEQPHPFEDLTAASPLYILARL